MRSKKATPKPRKTAFVPRALLTGAFMGAGVVPLCVTACGGKTQGQRQPLPSVALVMVDSGPDVVFTVACECFDASMGVADASFTVAYLGFDADAGPPQDADAGLMGDSDSGVGPDGAFGVADGGFG